MTSSNFATIVVLNDTSFLQHSHPGFVKERYSGKKVEWEKRRKQGRVEEI
jgi:hypothetical protein